MRELHRHICLSGIDYRNKETQAIIETLDYCKFLVFEIFHMCSYLSNLYQNKQYLRIKVKTEGQMNLPLTSIESLEPHIGWNSSLIVQGHKTVFILLSSNFWNDLVIIEQPERFILIWEVPCNNVFQMSVSRLTKYSLGKLTTFQPILKQNTLKDSRKINP